MSFLQFLLFTIVGLLVAKKLAQKISSKLIRSKLQTEAMRKHSASLKLGLIKSLACKQTDLEQAQKALEQEHVPEIFRDYLYDCKKLGIPYEVAGYYANQACGGKDLKIFATSKGLGIKLVMGSMVFSIEDLPVSNHG